MKMIVAGRFIWICFCLRCPCFPDCIQYSLHQGIAPDHSKNSEQDTENRTAKEIHKITFRHEHSTAEIVFGVCSKDKSKNQCSIIEAKLMEELATHTADYHKEHIEYTAFISKAACQSQQHNQCSKYIIGNAQHLCKDLRNKQ